MGMCGMVFRDLTLRRLMHFLYDGGLFHSYHEDQIPLLAERE